MEVPRSKRVNKRVEQPKVENKNFTAGCSLCDRTFSVIVPANVVPNSLADRALMTSLNAEFDSHNNVNHAGQSSLTLIG